MNSLPLISTGRLRPEFFPAIFGPGADRPLDAAATRAAFARLAAEVGRPAEAVAEGFLRIATENMANAIKKISVQRGHDVTRYYNRAVTIMDVEQLGGTIIEQLAALFDAA